MIIQSFIIMIGGVFSSSFYVASQTDELPDCIREDVNQTGK